MNSERPGYLFILFLLLFPGISRLEAQPGGRILLQPKDTLNGQGKASAHAIYAGAGYGSNMIYLGSTISGNLPFEYASVAYGYRNSLSASVSAVHLNSTKPFGAFYIGSITYSHTFNSWFDISTNIYRYQVASSLTDALFSSFVYADLTLGFDWRLLYSKISAGGMFSKENTSYFQLRNSRYFQTPDFFRGKASVSFDPYFNMLFGTLVSAETGTTTVYTYSQPGRKWRFKNPDQITYTNFVKRFGLLEMDFGLPVSLNTDSFTIEAEADYVLPLHDTPDYPGPRGFIFTLSAFFRIL
jgi:hypothetical protein